MSRRIRPHEFVPPTRTEQGAAKPNCAAHTGVPNGQPQESQDRSVAQRNRDTTSADARATNKTGTNATKDIPKPTPDKQTYAQESSSRATAESRAGTG